MKLKPSGYVTAAESEKPGYLARRFAKFRAEQREREAEQTRLMQEAAAERTKKVRNISKGKA